MNVFEEFKRIDEELRGQHSYDPNIGMLAGAILRAGEMISQAVKESSQPSKKVETIMVPVDSKASESEIAATLANAASNYRANLQ